MTARCWPMAVFRIFPLINTGSFRDAPGPGANLKGQSGKLTQSRMQYIHRHLLCDSAYSHYMAATHVGTDAALLDRRV
jgi:hypothetical protein